MSSPSVIKLILIGVGNVGRALVTQIHASRAHHAQRFGLQFNVVGLADSTGYLHSDALAHDTLMSVLAAKHAGQPLANHSAGTTREARHLVQSVADSNTIVIDCSASSSTIDALLDSLSKGSGIIMANKKPLCCPMSQWRTLVQPVNVRRLRYESTVGAGTPFITTVNRLIAANDIPTRIQGTFSGTLGFLCSGLETGRLYSEIVNEAYQLGYTEPDPRDDLGGVDVARKALILARSLGWSLELIDVSVEPLYPESLAQLPVKEFLASLKSLDDRFVERHRAAQSTNSVLRYVATIANGQCAVGLRAIAKDSPLGRLQGTENLVEFYTGIYNQKPLVVQGAGAGGEVTAAGVLADCVELGQLLASSSGKQS